MQVFGFWIIDKSKWRFAQRIGATPWESMAASMRAYKQTNFIGRRLVGNSIPVAPMSVQHLKIIHS